MATAELGLGQNTEKPRHHEIVDTVRTILTGATLISLGNALAYYRMGYQNWIPALGLVIVTSVGVAISHRALHRTETQPSSSTRIENSSTQQNRNA